MTNGRAVHGASPEEALRLEAAPLSSSNLRKFQVDRTGSYFERFFSLEIL
jgi:hypothetical protein